MQATAAQQEVAEPSQHNKDHQTEGKVVEANKGPRRQVQLCLTFCLLNVNMSIRSDVSRSLDSERWVNPWRDLMHQPLTMLHVLARLGICFPCPRQYELVRVLLSAGATKLTGLLSSNTSSYLRSKQQSKHRGQHDVRPAYMLFKADQAYMYHFMIWAS